MSVQGHGVDNDRGTYFVIRNSGSETTRFHFLASSSHQVLAMVEAALSTV